MYNIIFITMDCVRSDRLSCYGYNHMQTINIDKLAEDSVIFERAICQAPYTPASHMSYLSSLNPYNHGVRDMWNSIAYDNVVLISNVLKDVGYDTAGFVGLPDMSTYGLNRGFNYFDQNSNLQDWVCKGRQLGNDWRGSFKKWDDNRNKSKPVFIWFHHFLTHEGSDRFIPDKYLGVGTIPDKPSMKNYDAKIKWFDEEFLPIIIERFPENSIIILTADHGESIFKYPKEIHRKYLTDNTIKIPLIIKHPDLTKKIIRKQVCSIDVFPSILDLQGLTFSNVDGLTNLFDEDSSSLAYSETRYKDIFRKSICTSNYKVIFNRGKLESVYDLKKDPFEENDLSTDYKNQRFDSPEVWFLISKLKDMGGIGDEKDINRPKISDDEEKIKRLTALGYI